MVRFSDMLGGDGEPDDARAATEEPDLTPLVDDDAPDPEAAPVEDDPAVVADDVTPEPEVVEPSAQEVLDRLTRYAAQTRAAEATARSELSEIATPSEPDPPDPPDPPAPAAGAERRPSDDDAGDDILPRGKRTLRNPRGTGRD